MPGSFRLDWASWIYGLVAGFVGGGAGAVLNGLTAVGISPTTFNLNDQFKNTLKLMAASFIVSGITTTAAFLHQQPLPEKEPEPGQVEQPGAQAK